MGSCMSHLPFHAGGGRGPKSITWTPAMAKHNSRDFITTVPSYGIIPVMRSKQENYHSMQEVNDLSQHVSFSRKDDDYERKIAYRYRIFEHVTSWKT